MVSQKVSIKWLREDDMNSDFLHSSLKGRTAGSKIKIW